MDRQQVTEMHRRHFADRRFLIVENDRTVREGLLHVLRHEGADVETAESGEGAVEIVAKGWSFDVMLVDLVLPGMDGAECAHLVRAMRGIVRAGNVEVILGMSGDRHRLAAKRSDFDAIIVKPFSRDALIEKLERLGTHERAAASSC